MQHCLVGGVNIDHNEIAALCRSMIAKRLDIDENEIPTDPWDGRIYDFAIVLSRMDNFNEQTIRAQFERELNGYLSKVK